MGKSKLKAQQRVPQKKVKSFLEKRALTKVKDWNAGKTITNRIKGAGINAFKPGENSVQSVDLQLSSVGSRQDAFEKAMLGDAAMSISATELKSNANREAENTRRNFYRELKKLLAAADVVVQVLDARDPLSCRSEALEREVLAANKKLILVLNKIDLIPIEVCEEWLRLLKKDYPTIAFKAARNNAVRCQHSESNLEGAYRSGVLDSKSGVVGAGDLIQLVKNYSRSSGGELTGISVGIVGYPNVGKSSLINSLKRSCVVKVGGTAGVTRAIQEVQLDSKVRLIDSPGVVFSGNSEDPGVVLRSAVKVEHLEDPAAVLRGILPRFPVKDVEKQWNVTLSLGPEHFLTQLAKQRGKFKRGGVVCHTAAARLVLQDMMSGKFRYYARPPVARDKDQVKVVESMGQEFSINDAMETSVVRPEPKTREERAVERKAKRELSFAVDMPEDMDTS